MLRSLVDEVVRRRLWPIPLVALLVAIAAPLLFMKSAPADTAGAGRHAGRHARQAARRAGASSWRRPTRASLVVKRSKRKAPGSRSRRRRPPPRRRRQPRAADRQDELRAVGPDRRHERRRARRRPPRRRRRPPARRRPSARRPRSPRSRPRRRSTDDHEDVHARRTTTPKVTVPTTTSSSAVRDDEGHVRRRALRQADGHDARYRVPRLQTFRAGGKVAAMFVGYSAARNAAVFAVAPSTQVSGVKCRKVKGVCRYVDLPAGASCAAHARRRGRQDRQPPPRRRRASGTCRRSPGSKASARMTTLPDGEVPAEAPASAVRDRSVDLRRRLCVTHPRQLRAPRVRRGRLHASSRSWSRSPCCSSACSRCSS